MIEGRKVREIHDLTDRVAQHYIDEYGDRALGLMEEAAQKFEEIGNLHERNRMLRLRDEILILQIPDAAE